MDLIERQAAIYFLENCEPGEELFMIESLPSAQPEVRTQMSSADCISRQDAIDAIIRESTADGAYGYVDTKSSVDLIRKLPSAQPSLLDALKIIEQFLQGCRDSLTCEIIAPNGMKLHTDWGYFEEGLEELRRYAERKDNG